MFQLDFNLKIEKVFFRLNNTFKFVISLTWCRYKIVLMLLYCPFVTVSSVSDYTKHSSDRSCFLRLASEILVMQAIPAST